MKKATSLDSISHSLSRSTMNIIIIFPLLTQKPICLFFVHFLFIFFLRQLLEERICALFLLSRGCVCVCISECLRTGRQAGKETKLDIQNAAAGI
jgi:hypothetical protein